MTKRAQELGIYDASGDEGVRVTPETLAEALASVESQAPSDANEDERREWRDKAERIIARLEGEPRDSR
jgi:hypothetical protein